LTPPAIGQGRNRYQQWPEAQFDNRAQHRRRSWQDRPLGVRSSCRRRQTRSISTGHRGAISFIR
jgi:hypothetical protein